MLMLSVPAAMTMSASPVRMRSAAIDTAFSPDEQKRLIVMPGTLAGSPASSTPMRATFMPCSYSGIAQPTMTSSTRAGSSAGTCASTRCSTCASSVSGRVVRYAPRGALPTAVRVAATMYASWIWLLIVVFVPVDQLRSGLPVCKRVRDARLRPRVLQQRHELASLELEQPALVDEAPGIDVAAAHARARDARPTS